MSALIDQQFMRKFRIREEKLGLCPEGAVCHYSVHQTVAYSSFTDSTPRTPIGDIIFASLPSDFQSSSLADAAFEDVKIYKFSWNSHATFYTLQISLRNNCLKKFPKKMIAKFPNTSIN
uniref:Uncharacterized protein n=1 Tax=Heterorhabditis bacteriophora TaxID=37862 RepID=A0A1I7XAL9_HETBA